MPHSLEFWIGLILYALIPAFAAWQGGRAERWAALVVFADSIAYLFANDMRHPSDPHLHKVCVEAAELVGLFLVARRYPRSWLLAATGTQVLATTFRIVPALDHRIQARAWITLEMILGYIVLACLTLGTVQAMRARWTDVKVAPAQP